MALTAVAPFVRRALVALVLTALVAPPVSAEEWSHRLVGAGDIASCLIDTDEATAELVERLGGDVFTLGDNVYPDGTAQDFSDCYEPTWGRFKDRTRPVIGNHEYGVPRVFSQVNPENARAYFDYFGANAGTCCRGYYRYDVGPWRIYALNSELSTGRHSRQYRWLKRQLARFPHECVIAMWHKPLFASIGKGGWPKMSAIYSLLYANGTELVLNGHIHAYERMAPANPLGAADPDGIREIIAGTGGAERMNEFYPDPLPIEEYRDDSSNGVLVLDLTATAYSWQYVRVDGTVADSGTDECH
jgi:hypothetical protein